MVLVLDATRADPLRRLPVKVPEAVLVPVSVVAVVLDAPMSETTDTPLSSVVTGMLYSNLALCSYILTKL